jgi:geranylgeranyl reductase family protein
MNIIIAGGGIAGCYTGQLLKEKGMSPVLFEEHSEIGKPVQCAGLIGREVVETSQIPFPQEAVLRQIDGARVFLKNDWFEIERKKAAYVIDRARLDSFFSQGLTIHKREKVITCTEDTTVAVTTTKGTYTCDVVFGCDGPFSVVRKNFSLKAAFYPGAQYIVGLAPEDDFVELHVNPPFFFWVIPETEETTRIGVVGPDPVHELDRFIRRKEIRGKIFETHAGVISLGYGDIATKRVALVGDAACQVKPLTGGGIFYSMKAAEIAVEHVDDLLQYEKEWKEEYGREIKAGLKMRTIYENMSEKNLGRVFRIFKENKDVIEDIADFERHTSIAREFLKHPTLLKVAGSALKEFFTQ